MGILDHEDENTKRAKKFTRLHLLLQNGATLVQN